MLYFAYGSNLNVEQMLQRCPRAVKLGKLTLRDAKLVFRGVADCVYEPGGRCPGGIWKISPACERALDVYEGISTGLYRKEFMDIEGIEGESQIMLYSMNSTGIMPPSQRYLDVIRQGYIDFKLPLDYLRAAVRESWDDKAPSHIERRRRIRDGRPPLGLSKTVLRKNDGKTGSASAR